MNMQDKIIMYLITSRIVKKTLSYNHPDEMSEIKFFEVSL